MIFLIIPTILFWLVPIIQANFISPSSGDWLFLLILGWSWYAGIIKQRSQVRYWEFIVPVVVGLGMSSFLFSPIYNVLVYILPFLVLSAILFKKGVWLLRWKESIFSYLAIFLFYSILQVALRRFNLESFIDSKTFTTFVVGLFLIIFLVANKDRGRLVIR